MIKAKFAKGKSTVTVGGNLEWIIADLMASTPIIIDSVFKRLGLSKETEKDIVREIISNLEKQFLQ